MRRAVVPCTVRTALVRPHDADAAKPDRLIREDRPLVVRRRVDRQPVVASPLDEVSGEGSDGVRADALAVT